MCGIVGVVYGPNGPSAGEWTPSESAELMFPNVEHRGRDSFGWIHYRKSGAIQLRKFAEAASDGIEKVKESHRFGIPRDVRWWIGHVRLATHGTAKYTHNNHPIVHGDIMGVHNGIVFNYGKILADTGRQHKKAEVDSEAIFAAIHKHGVVEGLDKLDALAATVFVDRTNPDVVYFATCDANPLILARTKAGNTYFASEAWILEDLKLEWDEEPWKMDDYTLYVLDSGVEREYVQYADPKEKAASGFGQTYNYGNSTGYSRGWSSYGDTRWDDENEMYIYDNQTGVWVDRKTGKQGSTPLVGSSSASEYDVECMNCNWSGDEWDCENGECPQCGSFAYLIPKGYLDDDSTARRTVLAEIDEAVLSDPNDIEYPWIRDIAEARRKGRENMMVVCEDGRIVTKEQYDTINIIGKTLAATLGGDADE